MSWCKGGRIFVTSIPREYRIHNKNGPQHLKVHSESYKEHKVAHTLMPQTDTIRIQRCSLHKTQEESYRCAITSTKERWRLWTTRGRSNILSFDLINKGYDTCMINPNSKGLSLFHLDLILTFATPSSEENKIRERANDDCGEVVAAQVKLDNF